jgi:hypothetical protein
MVLYHRLFAGVGALTAGAIRFERRRIPRRFKTKAFAAQSFERAGRLVSKVDGRR